ncbi:MAG: MBL fold metallo-hydrolase [Pseudomonadota bacterium]
MGFQVVEADKIEILTLQDNYVDMVSGDSNQIVRRAIPLKGLEVKNSVLAEHGFSSVVTVHKDGASRAVLFDFGFSEHGAAFNAEALNVDLTKVEVLALSHGHLDHVGGLEKLAALTGRKGLDLVVHPTAFRQPRFLKIAENFNAYFPPFTREKAEKAGLNLVETDSPLPLLGGLALFLGQIPRTTDFEKGAPNLFYEKDGVEIRDTFEDDTALVMNLKGKGLVVLSGCAHSGIINTLRQARELTGVEKIHAVMGGFHLAGPVQKPAIAPTVAGLKDAAPDYIVPTHCTGREAINLIEREMPGKFLLNMSGTTMCFEA